MTRRTETSDEAERKLRVGTLLRNAREKAGMTLNTVHEKLKVSVPYLSDVERGNRNILPQNLRKLVGVLGMPEDETHIVFKEAQCLPPEVERRVLQTPKIWQHDPAKLLVALGLAQEYLGGTGNKDRTLKAIQEALRPIKW